MLYKIIKFLDLVANLQSKDLVANMTYSNIIMTNNNLYLRITNDSNVLKNCFKDKDPNKTKVRRNILMKKKM